MVSILFMNFLDFDWSVFLAALIEFILFFILLRFGIDLKSKMNPSVYIPDKEYSKFELENYISGISENKILKKYNRNMKFYSFFTNIIGIFPLLGILGTVRSLLKLVSDTADITTNFYGALTSTFWGIVFAIAFKLLDAVIAPIMEDNEKSVDLYLARNHEAEKITV